jgi:DNA-binding transcriptional regulator YiaG
MDQFRAAAFYLLGVGMTEKDVAKYLGVARGSVRAWEGK